MARRVRGLKLEEFSDKELLHRISDLVDNDGWVSTTEFAEALKLDHPHPVNCVGVRFAWMRRYGVLERNGTKWRLTAAGEAVVGSALSKSQMTALEKVAGAQGMEAMTRMASLYADNRDHPYGHLIRRAWRYGSVKR